VTAKADLTEGKIRRAIRAARKENCTVEQLLDGTFRYVPIDRRGMSSGRKNLPPAPGHA
jgi:hypothetical protein